MFQKYRKLLCCMLAMAILFSGVYFESTQAESMFLNTSVESTLPGIYSNEAKIITSEACTAEMLGISDRFQTRLLTGGMIVNRRENQLAVDYLCLDNSLQLLTNHVAALVRIHLPESNNGEVLLTYIHNSDGKKRI